MFCKYINAEKNNPMMQVYRHTEKNFLLFAPFLCGSSYIRQNAEKMKLVRIEEQNWRLQLSLVQAYFPHVENRFVLFRDPFQKIVSFFSKFVYTKKYRGCGRIVWQCRTERSAYFIAE